MVRRTWLAAALVAAVAAWPAGGAAQQDPPDRPAAAIQRAKRAAPVTAPATVPVRQGTAGRKPAREATRVVRDPAEYKAYVAALLLTDPSNKAAAIQAFLAKYPDSAVKIEALEHAMAAYRQVGDTAMGEATATTILGLQRNNVRALAHVTFLRRARASQGDALAPADMRAGAELGLRTLPSWSKPDGLADAEFERLRKQMAAIFNGALGFDALQAKEHARARAYYLKAVADDATNLQDVYQLAIAHLQADPIDVAGFWYVAKAVHMAKDNEAAQQSIASYGKAKYKHYHGAEDGWDELVARVAVAARPAPPAEFTGSIKPAPSAAERAVLAVRDNDPASLSISEWKSVLSQRDASPANKDAAAKVWQAIQAKQQGGTAKLRIPAKVVVATKDTIQAAITDDNQKDNKADLLVVTKSPMAFPPASGAAIEIVGLIVDYIPSPLVFIMRDGELAAK